MGVTAHPAGVLTARQARDPASGQAASGSYPRPGQQFAAASDDVFSGNGTRVIKTPVLSPRANPFAERFVITLRRE